MKALNTSNFPPTLAAAKARIAAVRPGDYARTRNAVEGAVTRLSPYITHGFVTLPEVLAGVAARHRLDVQHKFVFELGWREYFHHVWQHQGEGILQSLHEGVLPEAAYSPAVPADIRQARTGVPAIDQAVRTLYATGYLHNHARMWLASYVVHLRKVHWRAGADWLFSHLLDGDLASNHLSWQWVAGTGSSKPYLFNADNVARYAPAAWHSAGSVIDTSYEALDAMARSSRPLRAAPQGAGVEEPVVTAMPPADARRAGGADTQVETQVETLAESLSETLPETLAKRDVWLVHPWALGAPPSDLPPHCVCLAWWPAEALAARPWSAARWAFAGTRMAELAALNGSGSREQLAKVLASARTVQTVANPHMAGQLPAQVQQRATPRLFAEVDRPCTSFSTWWNRSTRGVKHLHDLPGLAALAASSSAGPLFDAASASTTDSLLPSLTPDPA